MAQEMVMERKEREDLLDKMLIGHKNTVRVKEDLFTYIISAFHSGG